MKNKEILVSQNQEIAYGEEEQWLQKFFKAFPALKYRNYQLYSFGQLISLIGFWLQQVAQGWLVLQITGSSFWVGTIGALNALPILLFGLFAGLLIDRFNTKLLLQLSQFTALILVGILGFLTVTGAITLWQIAIIVFLLGIVAAMDMPARQAFAIEMVGKKDLSSAIALNSGMFNGARVIGPAVSGLLISLFGLAGAFFINALTYVPIIIALHFIKTEKTKHSINTNPYEAIKMGITYSFSHPVIRPLLLLTAISSIFGWSYSNIMPVVVEQVFHAHVETLGLMYAASGVGALFGTIIVSYYFTRVNPMLLIILGNILFCTTIFLFTFTTSILISLPFLFLSGLGLLVQFATLNSVIQHVVTDSIRGRVMSIYVLMFAGMIPLGSFQIGVVSEYFGPSWGIRLGAIVIFIFGMYFLLNRKKYMDRVTHYIH